MKIDGLIVIPSKKVDMKINDQERQTVIHNAVALIKQKGYDIRPFKNAEVFPNHWLIKYPEDHNAKHLDGLPKGPGPVCNVIELLDLAEKLPVYQRQVDKKKTLVLKSQNKRDLSTPLTTIQS